MTRIRTTLAVTLTVLALESITSEVSAFATQRIAAHQRSILAGKHQQLRIHRRPWKAPIFMLAKKTRNRNSDTDNDENLFFSLLDNASRLVTTPIPFFPADMSLPLVYPVTILILALTGTLSPLGSLILAILFGVFRFLGGTVLQMEQDQDDEEPPINFLAFGAAFLSSFLVTPSTTPTMTTAAPSATALTNINVEFPLFLLASTVGIGLLVGTQAFLQNDKEDNDSDMPSPEQQRMELWDRDFQNSQQKSNERRK